MVNAVEVAAYTAAAAVKLKKKPPLIRGGLFFHTTYLIHNAVLFAEIKRIQYFLHFFIEPTIHPISPPTFFLHFVQHIFTTIHLQTFLYSTL